MRKAASEQPFPARSDKDAERALFEQAEPGTNYERDGDYYVNPYTQCAWEGFQAGIGAQSTPAGEAQERAVICGKCGANRLAEPCGNLQDCGMIGTAYTAERAPSGELTDERILEIDSEARKWGDGYCEQAISFARAIEREVLASNAATAAPGDLPVQVRVLAEKWNQDAIDSGFAMSEPACEVFDLLDHLASNAGAAPDAEQVNEMRIALTVQLDSLIDLGDRYARRMKGKDDDESRYAQGAIDHARKVAAPYKYNGPYRAPSNPPVGAAPEKDK